MKTLNIILMAGLLSFLFGCKAQTKSPETTFQSVSVGQFEQIIADTLHVVRLDVRSPQEYAVGHIPSAINIDVLQDDFEPKALSILPKDKTIALYCRSGRRSKKAAEILSKHQYKVVELDAGFNGWTAQGKTTEE